MDVRQEVLNALEKVADDADQSVVDTVLDELMGKLAPYIERATRPNLGFAATLELIQELHARASVAHTIGEEWPVYRPVGSA